MEGVLPKRWGSLGVATSTIHHHIWILYYTSLEHWIPFLGPISDFRWSYGVYFCATSGWLWNVSFQVKARFFSFLPLSFPVARKPQNIGELISRTTLYQWEIYTAIYQLQPHVLQEDDSGKHDVWFSVSPSKLDFCQSENSGNEWTLTLAFSTFWTYFLWSLIPVA